MKTPQQATMFGGTKQARRDFAAVDAPSKEKSSQNPTSTDTRRTLRVWRGSRPRFQPIPFCHRFSAQRSLRLVGPRAARPTLWGANYGLNPPNPQKAIGTAVGEMKRGIRTENRLVKNDGWRLTWTRRVDGTGSTTVASGAVAALSGTGALLTLTLKNDGR